MRWRCFRGSGAKIIAGGHSLVPLMKLRLSEPSVLIDIARIPGLSGVREAGGAIEIGACTTHHQVATSALLLERCPMLAEAAGSIGDPQVRNRGTLGGSLAHADPSADYPAAMLALDATVHVQGRNGARSVAARDFFQGVFTVDLAPDELIVGVRFTPVKTGPTPACASVPRTSRSSASRPRSTWPVARSAAHASASPAPGRPPRA